MGDELYRQRAELYDTLYREKPYEEEAKAIERLYEEHGRTDENSVLVLGCGTGGHTEHLEQWGYDVVATDKYEAMLEVAERKSDARFRQNELPAIDVEGTFGLVLLPFTVVNFLDGAELETLARNVREKLCPGGVAVFDNDLLLDFEGDFTEAYLETHADEGVGRLNQYHRVDGNHLKQRSVVFVAGESDFVNEYEVWFHPDESIRAAFDDEEFEVYSQNGYRRSDASSNLQVYALRRRE